jgi:PKHD-type hydroxylase
MASFPVTLPGLLTASEISTIQEILKHTPFEDGRKTAFGKAQDVKHNLQVPRGDEPHYQQLSAIFANALNQSPLLQAVARPKAVVPPLISRYEPGHEYGYHVDSPLMGGDGLLRTDLGMTIFLNEPTEYEGGELSILMPSGEMRFKLKAGDAILYPTLYVHGVLPVTQGQRQVMVTWIQSTVSDPLQRDILYQLQALETVYQQKLPGASENLTLQQVYSNLVRMWAN